MYENIQQQIAEEITSEQMKKAISTLPASTEMVIRLRYEQGKSLDEICILLNKSISIIRNHHNRGLFLVQKFYTKSKAGIL